MATSAPGRPSVLALAVPALVVLAAEPIYLLVDTAVVGHLGTVPLAGLAVGGGLLAWATALLNFLAYGTTARAARRAGAGDRVGAVAQPSSPPPTASPASGTVPRCPTTAVSTRR